MKKGKPIKVQFFRLPGSGASAEEALAAPHETRFRFKRQIRQIRRQIRRLVATVQESTGLRALLFGLLWMLATVGIVMALLPEGEGFSARYAALSAGDISAYEEVMEGGLARLKQEHVPPTVEGAETLLARELQVAPGYPLTALLVQKAMAAAALFTGQAAPGARLALAVTAQLMTWALWGYVVAFLARWKAGLAPSLFAATLLMLHPEALSLVGIGPGALFLAMLLGMVYWAGAAGGGLLSALHGAGASAARLFVAVPAILSGLLLVRRKRRRGMAEGVRSLERRALIAILSLLPLGLYLAVLQGRFGAIDLYLKSLGLTSKTLDLLGEPAALWQAVAQHVGEPMLAAWGGLIALFVVAEFILLMQEMWLRVESRFRARAPFYLMAAAFFLMSVVATALHLKTTGAAEPEAQLSPFGFGFELYLMVILAFSHILSRLATRTLVGKAVTIIVVGLMAFLQIYLQFWAQEGRGLIALLE